MKITDLVEKLGGTFTGDSSVEISAVAEPEHAEEGDLSWVGDARYTQHHLKAAVLLLSTLASMVAGLASAVQAPTMSLHCWC